MKSYSTIYEIDGTTVSTATFEARNIRDARAKAQFHKVIVKRNIRSTWNGRIKTSTYLIK